MLNQHKRGNHLLDSQFTVPAVSKTDLLTSLFSFGLQRNSFWQWEQGGIRLPYLGKIPPVTGGENSTRSLSSFPSTNPSCLAESFRGEKSPKNIFGNINIHAYTKTIYQTLHQEFFFSWKNSFSKLKRNVSSFKTKPLLYRFVHMHFS